MPLNPRLNTGQWNLRRQQKYIWVTWYCRPVRVAFEVKRIFNERISWNKPLTHGNAVVLSTMYLQWESRAVCVVSSVNEVHLLLFLSAHASLVIELPKPCVRLIICGSPRSLSSLWVLCMRHVAPKESNYRLSQTGASPRLGMTNGPMSDEFAARQCCQFTFWKCENISTQQK